MPLAPVSLNSRVTKTRRDTKTKALAPDQKTILSYFKLKSAEEDYEQDQQANDPSLLINNKPEPAEKHPGQVQQVCDPSPLIRKALSGDGNAAANTSKVDTKSKAKRSSPPSAAAHPLVVRSEPQNVDHVSDIDVFLDIADNLGGEDDSNDAKIVIEDVVNTSDSIADIGFFVDSVLQAEKSLQSCHDPQNPLKPIEAVDRAPDAIGSAQKKHAAALKSITAAREASSYGSISKDHPQDYKSTSIETLALLGVTPADRSSWSSCLMGLINMSDLIGIEEPLRVFFQRCKEDETWRHQSVEPVDAFVADAAPLSWRTHDPLIDDKWMELTQEVEALSEGRIVASTMPKPSGPLNAALTFVWHYPTWRTRGGTFGFVMDPTNPSLRAQHVKLGPSPLIRTLDMLLIRENFTEEGVCWADVYPNWEQINEKFSKFNRWLNRHSKIIVAVSRGVVDSLQDVVEFDDGATDIIEVRLDAPVKPFGKEPFFYVLQDRRTREIKQVVFLSYHAQYFYYRDPPMPQRAYHELLWNAAADLAGIHVVTPVYFLLQIRRAVPKNTRFDNTCMHRAIRLRAHEKRCDIIIPQFVVERILGPMIRRQGWTELRTSQGQAGQGTPGLNGASASTRAETGLLVPQEPAYLGGMASKESIRGLRRHLRPASTTWTPVRRRWGTTRHVSIRHGIPSSRACRRKVLEGGTRSLLGVERGGRHHGQSPRRTKHRM